MHNNEPKVYGRRLKGKGSGNYSGTLSAIMGRIKGCSELHVCRNRQWREEIRSILITREQISTSKTRSGEKLIICLS